MARRKVGGCFAPKLIAVAVASCFASAPAWGNPTGAQVVNGTVGFARPNASTLRVTNSPGAIINWQGFSIGPGEITRFVQQSPSSAVLNRVVGADISSIQGQLLSNGRVFLINPAGILIGAGAVIDTAGFVGSTLSMQDADFLAGKLKFQGDGTSGRIVNQGWIRTTQGGQVMLVAPQIENSGLIHTPKGELILAAGRKLTISSLDYEGVQFEIQAPTDSIVNVGKLLAEGGAIGAFAGTLKHSGEIRATSLAVDATGQIVLKAQKDIDIAAGSTTSASGVAGGKVQVQSGDTTLVSGSIEARGGEGKGGTIHILGDNVGLIDGARVDASGQTGGGTVLVGGDFQGKNSAIQNAFRAYVAPGAVIATDAIAKGDGGTVIVWADDATRFYGNISARGGTSEGNGGFAEVSGKNYLDYRGQADLSAAAGTTGVLFLDPNNVEIRTDVASGGGTFSGGDPNIFGGGNTTSQILWNTIKANLTTADVRITTSGGGAAAGNITVVHNSPDLATSRNLRLLAHNDITLNGSITNTGSGAIDMFAGWNEGSGTANPAVVSGTGTININQSVLTKAAELNFTAGKDISIANGVTIENAPASGGSVVNIHAVGGTVTSNAGTIRAIGGDEAPATVTLQGAGITVNNSTIVATGGLGPDGPGGSATVQLLAQSSLDISNNSSISANAGDGFDGGGATVTLQGLGGGISINGSSITARGGDSGGDGGFALVTLTGASITLGASPITAAAGIGSGFTGATANMQLTATGGNVSLSNSNLISTGGSATVDGAATIDIIAQAGAILQAGGGQLQVTSPNNNATRGIDLQARDGVGTTGAPIRVAAGFTSLNANNSQLWPGGSGDIVLAQTAGDVNLGPLGGYTLTNGAAGGGVDIRAETDSIIVPVGPGFSNPNGPITFRADSMDIQGPVTAAGGSGSISLQTVSAARPIQLGTIGDAVAALALSDAELSNLSGGSITIGTAANPVSVTQPITLSQAVSLPGGVTVLLAGDLGVNGTSTLGSLAGAGGITLNGGDLIVGGGNTSTLFSGTINGNGGLTKQGTGTLTLSGTNTYTGITTVNAGALALNGGTAIANTGAVNLAASGARLTLGASETIGSLTGVAGTTVALGTHTLTAGNAGDTNFAGVMSGTGGLTKQGAGTLFLFGANTYTGATRVNAGTLSIFGGAAIADSGAVIMNGGTFTLITDETIGSLTGAAGTTVALGANTLSVGDAGSTAFAGVINGTGGLTKRGTGTLTLSGANIYTGTTRVNAGTLALGASNVLANGSTLAVNGGTLDIGAFNDTVGGVQLVSGTIAGAGGQLTSTAGYDMQAGTVTANLGGAVGLNKTGVGTLTLSGANTYTGTTTVNAGTLALNGGAAILDTGAVDLAVAGAGLTLGASERIGSLSGVAGTTVALGTHTLTAGNAADTAFAGVMNGVGGLTKQGTGTLTLSGANTYTGATTVNAGTLALNGGAAILDTGAVDLAVAGAGLTLGASERIGSLSGVAGTTVALGTHTLTAGNAADTAFAGVMSGAGGLTKQGTGTLTLSGANTHTGATTVNAGTLVLSGATLSGSLINQSVTTVTGSSVVNGGVQHSGTLNLNGVLTVGTEFDWQGGTLAGAGSLVTSGAAPFKVTGAGAHTLNGPTISVTNLEVTGGSLNLQAGMVDVSDTITVGSGTTLASQGATISAPTLDLSGTFQSGAGSVTVGSMNVLAGGLLKGTGTLNGDVNNLAGTVSPGLSPGILTINGNYVQGTSGTLNMEIGGTVPGASGHDQLVVTGTAILGGTLNTSLINGFIPASADAFTLIKAGSLTGTFATTNLPTASLPAGKVLEPAYGVSSFVLSTSSPVVLPPVLPPVVPLEPSVVRENEKFIETVAEGPEKPVPPGPTAPICH